MNNKLKELREKRGLSQAEVAQEIGISRQMYNKYERGDTEPSLSAIKALCTLYNVSYEELLNSPAYSDSPVYNIDQSFGKKVLESLAVPYGAAKASSPAFGTENYYAQIINLLPHLLLSEKSRLLTEVAESITNEVEGKKSQPMKVDQSKVYFPTHEEYEKHLAEFLQAASSSNYSSNGVKWTRDEMHEDN